jgi:PAS domain S-box-containing protein
MGTRRGHQPNVEAEGDPPQPAVATDAARPTVEAVAAQGSGVGYYDREGRFLYATPTLAAYVGMTPEELIGRTWYDIGVPPEAVERLEATRRRVLETGRPASETASFQSGGILRETKFVIKPVKASDGSLVGTVVTAWDAVEDRASESGAARLDRAYSVLSAVDQVIVRARDSYVILSEACRIAAAIGGFELAWVGLLDAATGDVPVMYQAGRDEGLLPGQNISIRDDPSGRGVVGTALRENRTVIVQDIPHDPRMDAWRDFFDRLGYQTAAGFPIRVGGRPIGAIAMYSSERSHFDAAEALLFEQFAGDISNALTAIETARQKAEAQAALADSERRYRDLFNINPHPMGVYDVETGRFLSVNDAALAAYGYSRDEFLTMAVGDVVPAEDMPALLEEVGSVRPGGGYRPSGPWRQVRKDGSIFYAEVSTHAIDFDDRPARLVLAIDITERRRLEAQLSEATRLEAMGHLAGGIAHDFNNLLTAVNGYSDILVSELGDDPRVESALEIRRAGARAAQLTKQILAFARRQVLAPHPVDLNVVVDSVSQMLRRLIGEQIQLVARLDDLPAVVRADPGQLEQVLVNLAVNSRDAMPAGGVLVVEVHRVEGAAVLGHGIAGPAVLLTVTDTGIGMDEATLARVFEPFFTTKGVGVGTGLGLATVHGIVLQSSGEVWAESTVDHGTRVSVLLPRVEETPEVFVAPPLAVPGSHETATVLVVEDDAAVRALAVAALEHAGFRVLVAATPAQAAALSVGLEEPIDVLLTDLIMPGGNGRDLAERLLGGRPSMRVVLMSGYDATPSEGHHDDRFHFLAKPFGGDELVSTVRTVLGRPAA